MLSSWGSSNYRPPAPFLCEVASHVKNCHFGDYYYYIMFRLPLFSAISYLASLYRLDSTRYVTCTAVSAFRCTSDRTCPLALNRRLCGYSRRLLAPPVGQSDNCELNGNRFDSCKFHRKCNIPLCPAEDVHTGSNRGAGS